MFAKLLKYEWRSSRKTIATLCAVILISGLLIGSTTFAMVRWDSLSSGSDVLAIIPVLLISLCIMAAAVSCAASVFYVLWRFYKSRFTEEGYLTYTLPVNNHFLILSSLLMSTLEILLVLLAAAAAVVLAMGIFSLSLPWKAIGPDTWNAAWRILGEMGNELGRHGKECFLFFMTLLLGGISTLILQEAPHSDGCGSILRNWDFAGCPEPGSVHWRRRVRTRRSDYDECQLPADHRRGICAHLLADQ